MGLSRSPVPLISFNWRFIKASGVIDGALAIVEASPSTAFSTPKMSSPCISRQQWTVGTQAYQPVSKALGALARNGAAGAATSPVPIAGSKGHRPVFLMPGGLYLHAVVCQRAILVSCRFGFLYLGV